jgi:hypothetical protein
MMRKLILAIALVMAAPIAALAEGAPVNNAVPPCDDAKVTEKPPCSIDSESIKKPAQMPNEKGGVIVPPEVPAEGLPHQDREVLKNKAPPAPKKH